MFSWLCLGAYRAFYLVTLMYVCAWVCVRQKAKERGRKREIASEEIGGSILSRQEVCYSQREREQDTQRRVEGRKGERSFGRKRRKGGKKVREEEEKKTGGEMDGLRKSIRKEMEMGKEDRCGQ